MPTHAAGTRFGPYEILAKLGEGGMGDVYRARDTRLDRTVALKISKEEFTPRFETEARATAALEHPHICRLYDVCHEAGASFLVMEYVEGTPLAGPLPLDVVLAYARQIAGALDEAHRKRIIHRDLKPSNILVTPKGGVKLLDFGLAKLGPNDVPLDDGALTRGITTAGTILGTLHYMSPEQLQGGVADARSDIFAFGLVLYEMLTGRRAFDGASAASIIAAILERPAPSVLQVAPASLDRLIARCLAKDPEERWQSARDAQAALDLITEAPVVVQANPTAERRRSPMWALVTAGVLGTALAGLAYIHFRESIPEPHVIRFQIAAPERRTIISVPSVSPDGRAVAFVAGGTDSQRAIWVRAVEGLETRMLPGTEDATEVFWSPDSRFIGFSAGGRLKTIDVTNGFVRGIADVGAIGGGSWNVDGTIIFSRFQRGLYRVPATGGTPVQLTTLSGADSLHVSPMFLRDGRRFLYTAGTRGQGIEVRLATLDGPDVHRFPLEEGSRAIYEPPAKSSEPGRVLFVRGGTLFAQPVDDATFAVRGDSVVVVDNVGGDETTPGGFSLSATGGLVYVTDDLWNRSQLAWFDRQGTSLGIVGPTAKYNDLSISPDDSRVAVTRREGSNDDIWLIDLNQNVPSRFTTDDAQDWHPVWAPDGRRLAFSSTRPTGGRVNGIYWKDALNVGTEDLVSRSDVNQRVNDWSPDGKWLLVTQNRGRGDLWLVSAEKTQGAERKSEPFVESGQFTETRGQFYPIANPEARYWVAYSSNETGRYEIYVESFPRGSLKKVVSASGGMQPRWRKDGRELFYLSLDLKLMAVDVTATGTEMRLGAPRELFQTRMVTSGTLVTRVLRYDATRDGKRFLINSQSDAVESVSAPIDVVLNWTALLKR